jgi:hypothetical protein
MVVGTTETVPPRGPQRPLARALERAGVERQFSLVTASARGSPTGRFRSAGRTCSLPVSLCANSGGPGVSEGWVATHLRFRLWSSSVW